jgi:phosphoketolase
MMSTRRHARHPLAQADRLAQLPADLPRLAQDHNGFSHQDPGFIDHVVHKKAEVVRVYLPPDANTLLPVTDHCLRSRNDVNVIVAGKQPALQYLAANAFDALFTRDR